MHASLKAASLTRLSVVTRACRRAGGSERRKPRQRAWVNLVHRLVPACVAPLIPLNSVRRSVIFLATPYCLRLQGLDRSQCTVCKGSMAYMAYMTRQRCGWPISRWRAGA